MVSGTLQISSEMSLRWRSTPSTCTHNAPFAGFGGDCQIRNNGDPIILYDHLADRWLLSQFTTAAPFHQCVAISQTGDPTGAWYRYDFLNPGSNWDYPKFGVWPDGYYMSAGSRGIQNWKPRPEYSLAGSVRRRR